MALAYLLDPCKQYQNRAGVNNVNGWLEVFEFDTDDRATVYSDFAGTLAPAHIGIDNNGRAVMIVDSAIAYRVEMHAPNGELIFTQAPIWTVASGGGVGALVKVVSTDGTIDVQKTTVGAVTTYDLSTGGDEEPSTWGSKTCTASAVSGNNEWAELAFASSEGSISYNNGWTVTKKCAIDIAASIEMTSGDAAGLKDIEVKCEFFKNGTSVLVENGLVDPSKTIDRVSFEYKGAANKNDVINAVVSVRCAQSLTVGLVGRVFYNEECDGVIGGSGGGGGDYVAGEGINITGDVISIDNSVVQHKLVAGDNISINPVTNVISVTGLTQVQSDWEEDDPTDPAYIKHRPDLSQYVTESELAVDLSDYQKKLVAGTNITIDPVTNVISASGGSGEQVQSDWTEDDPADPAYIKHRPDLSQYATVTDLSGKADKVDNATAGNLAGLDATGNLTDSGIAASDVATQSDLSGKQDTLVAGDNITINSTTNVISATDTNTHRPIQLEGSQILGDNTDPLNFVAGSNVTITNSNGSLTIAASGGSGTQVQSDWTENDSSDPAYIKHRPAEKPLVAGANIAITEVNNQVVISSSASGIQSDWAQTNSSYPDFIRNKPDLSQYQEVLTAGSNITIDQDNVISATAAPQQQSNWAESNNQSVQYIQNKPSTKTLVAGNNVVIATVDDTVSISATVPAVGTVVV